MGDAETGPKHPREGVDEKTKPNVSEQTAEFASGDLETGSSGMEETIAPSSPETGHVGFADTIDPAATDKALTYSQFALDIALKLRAQDRLPNEHISLSSAYETAAAALKQAGDLRRSRDYTLKDLEHRQALRDQNPEDILFMQSIAKAYGELGELSMQLNETEKARTYFESGMQIRRDWVNKQADNPHAWDEFAGALGTISELALHYGEIDSAIKYADESLHTLVELEQQAPKDEEDKRWSQGTWKNLRRNLALKSMVSGYLRLVNGRAKEAQSYDQDAIQHLQKRAELAKEDMGLQDHLRSAHYEFGNVLSKLNKPIEAMKHYQLALKIRQEVAKDRKSPRKQLRFVLALARGGDIARASRAVGILDKRYAKLGSDTRVYLACCESICAQTVAKGTSPDKLSQKAQAQCKIHRDKAVSLLRRALLAGFNSYYVLRHDPDLEHLQGSEDFEELIQLAEQGKLKPPPKSEAAKKQ